jgi:putative sugar O-methyltransferase
MADFRANQQILKGFGQGGTNRPVVPAATAKRMIWNGVSAAPVVRTILAEHTKLIDALSSQLRRAQVAQARALLETIDAQHPDVRIPAGLANGGADDTFKWRGHTISADFVQYLARAADFYSVVKPETVTSILEIGPGLGMSTLAHLALNPHLRTIVNLDIVPVIYVSTQYLSSIPGLEVVGYKNLPDRGPIIPEASAGPRLYSLPAWVLPRLEMNADYAFNAFSFQEMEEGVCAGYAQHLNRLTRKGVLLHSSIAGHKPKAGGQTKPVTMAFLTSLFTPRFPVSQTVGGIWTRGYDFAPENAVLMRAREAAGSA